MQFATVEELTHAALADHEAGEEIAPGVVIERRSILRIGVRLGALAALAGAAPLSSLVGCADHARRKHAEAEQPETASISVEEFMRQIRPQASELIVAPQPDEQAYLAAVSRLLARIQPESSWQTNIPAEQWKMDRIAYYPPVMLFQIRMSPGAVIKLHDHRHYNGVLLSVAGAARIRNFDLVETDGRRLNVAAGEVPGKNEDFLIRENSDAVLRPGQLSTLSRDRDNIHHVEAGDEGCRLVDFFTHFRPEAQSYALHWDGKPYDAPKKLYKASWM